MSLLIVGAAANNITLATQNMRDYLPYLWLAVASFLCALGLLVHCWIRGGLAMRFVCVLTGLFALAQLFSASSRLLSIMNAV